MVSGPISAQRVVPVNGGASFVASGIRRSATCRRLRKMDREPTDICARYLLNHSECLNCHDRPEFENVIGCFVNTFVLCTDMSGTPTFRQLLTRVREVVLGAYIHHDLPFAKLTEALGPDRNPSQNPLFQVALTLEPPVMSSLDADLDWRLCQYDSGIETGTARFDLSFEFEEMADEIVGRVEYSTDLSRRGL